MSVLRRCVIVGFVISIMARADLVIAQTLTIPPAPKLLSKAKPQKGAPFIAVGVKNPSTVGIIGELHVKDAGKPHAILGRTILFQDRWLVTFDKHDYDDPQLTIKYRSPSGGLESIDASKLDDSHHEGLEQKADEENEKEASGWAIHDLNHCQTSFFCTGEFSGTSPIIAALTNSSSSTVLYVANQQYVDYQNLTFAFLFPEITHDENYDFVLHVAQWENGQWTPKARYPLTGTFEIDNSDCE